MPCCVPGSTRSTAVYCHASSWTCLCHRPSTVWILKNEGFIIIWCFFFFCSYQPLDNSTAVIRSQWCANKWKKIERTLPQQLAYHWVAWDHPWLAARLGESNRGNPWEDGDQPGHNKLSARRQCDDEYPVSFWSSCIHLYPEWSCNYP